MARSLAGRVESLPRDSWCVSNRLPVIPQKSAEERLSFQVADLSRSIRRSVETAERVGHVAVALRRDEARWWRLPNCLPVAAMGQAPNCG